MAWAPRQLLLRCSTSCIPAVEARGDVDLESALAAANVVVSLAAGNRIRVSPAVFNDESDIDALIEALNRA